jgi:hypothetical protein
VILRTPFEVFVESFVVCVKKNLMITTNIDDDDANLLMRKKLLMLCRTIVWNKIGVRPGRSVESVLVLGL